LPDDRLHTLDARLHSGTIVVADVRANKGNGSSAAVPIRRHPNQTMVLISSGEELHLIHLFVAYQAATFTETSSAAARRAKTVWLEADESETCES
jgi:hypothetical protein